MPQHTYTQIKGGVSAPKGFLANAVGCGIKDPKNTRLDLTAIVSEQPCSSAATFTTNKIKAAPLKLSQAHLKRSEYRAIIANSGNANACTGVQGIAHAKEITKSFAQSVGLKQSEIAICSTGVIGLPLPMMRISPHIEALGKGLCSQKGHEVAQAIMTSDTRPKEIAISLDIGGTRVRVGACAKGAGMICPNMATMLCFVTTDANIGRKSLKNLVPQAVEQSFNRITIDGDMSTNDTVIVLANGASNGPRIYSGSKEYRQLRDAIEHVMLEMAKAIVRDGERVTKFVTVKVKGARTEFDAKRVAQAVANSSLVKASWNGEDPNWGRIIHAAGYSGANVKEELIDIEYEGLPSCIGGLQAKTPNQDLQAIVEKREFTITIRLHQGRAKYYIYSSDLSPEYVDFNRSEYAYWKQAAKDGLI